MKREGSIAERLGLVGQPALLAAVTAAAAEDAGWDLVEDRPSETLKSAGQVLLSRVADLAGQAMVTDVVARDRLPVADDIDVAAALMGLSQVWGQIEGLMLAFVIQAHERRSYAETGLSLRDWVSARCPFLTITQVNDLVTVATQVATGGVFPRPSAAAYASLAAAVEAGGLAVGRAARVARTADKVRPVFDSEENFTEFVEALVELAKRPDLTDGELRSASDTIVAKAMPAKEQEEQERVANAMRGVTEIELADGELFRFVITTGKEGAATIRSITSSPLAAPVPDPATGIDERLPTQRRHDALLTVLGRGLASAEGVPTTDKAKMIVTIDWQVLQEMVNGAGITGTGEHLSPSLARKIACSAGIIPMVLGGDSLPLDVGRQSRLATPAQVKALWIRDKGCTFPGCTIPPGWCDAHHIIWWSQDGRSDLDNYALLCERHHTIVHEKDLTATVDGGQVLWHV